MFGLAISVSPIVRRATLNVIWIAWLIRSCWYCAQSLTILLEIWWVWEGKWTTTLRYSQGHDGGMSAKLKSLPLNSRPPQYEFVSECKLFRTSAFKITKNDYLCIRKLTPSLLVRDWRGYREGALHHGMRRWRFVFGDSKLPHSKKQVKNLAEVGATGRYILHPLVCRWLT